jgi:type II secretory pathway component GspD/PulD (secretin)
VHRIPLASLPVPPAATTAASQSVPLPPFPITRLDVRQADPDLDGRRILYTPNPYVDLAEGVRTLLSKDGRMNLDRSAAVLQVIDRPNRLAKVEQYLEAVMLRVTRQVQIEAHVIEVELREGFSAGINWRMVLSALTNTAAFAKTPARTTSGGVTLRLKAGDFTALLNALAAQGTVNVFANPRITAMNNEPAVMRTGTQDVPNITVREADTLVRVQDGETVVIAGLMHDRAHANSTKSRKTDLVILITPTLMRPGDITASARDVRPLEDTGTFAAKAR